MLHQHLADALALKRHVPGQHLEQNDAQGVRIDLAAVAAIGDLGRHVVDRADALGLPAPPAARNEFRQPIVADLDHAFVDEDIARLQIAMDDAVVVQIADAGADALHPGHRLLGRHPVRTALDHVFQRFAGNVFHDHPLIAPFVRYGCRTG